MPIDGAIRLSPCDFHSRRVCGCGITTGISSGRVEVCVQTAETLAKVALLNHLRTSTRFRRCSVISELVVEGWTRRADIVTAGRELVAYEIKSRADRLDRLDDQIATFGSVSERVYAVLATKHMNVALSRLPQHVGIRELVCFNGRVEVRDVREAEPSPDLAASPSLSLLPVLELSRLVRGAGIPAPPGLRRPELLERAGEIPLTLIRAHVTTYLRERHCAQTEAFAASIAGRRVQPEDLEILSIWRKDRQGSATNRKISSLTRAEWLEQLAASQALGVIPDDLRELFQAA